MSHSPEYFKSRECRFTIQRTGSPLDFEVYDYDEKRIVAVCKSWEDGGLVAAALTDFTNKAQAEREAVILCAAAKFDAKNGG